MPIECIVSENDRELITGLGNWTGDATWEAGPVLGREGVMRFRVLTGPESKIESLAYPHVEIPAGKHYLLKMMSVAIPFEPAEYMSLKITITSGATTIGPLEGAGYAQADWHEWSVEFDTPAGWDETDAIMTLTAENVYVTERNLYVDHFSLLYYPTAKTDHLPLMGVH